MNKNCVKMDFTSITKKIENSKPLDFSSIFSRSLELFKEVWLQGFMTLLFTVIAIIPFYILIYLPIIGTALVNPDSFQNDSPPTLMIAALIILIPIVILGIMMVSMAMSAAFMRICKLKDLKQAGSDDYFFFLKKRYHGKLLKLSLLSFGMILLGYLACLIGVFYVIVPVSLIPAFLAFDDELSAMEIVKSSIALANKNWVVIFGLIIVVGLVAQLGILLCGIGILFTASLTKIPVYFMYKDAINEKIGNDKFEDRINNLISPDLE